MNIKNFLKSSKEFCGKHWKKWIILAILIMVIYIGFIFYQYIYKPIYQPKEVTAQRLEIKKNIYQRIMNRYSRIGENINQIFNKNYPDPFK